jgi:hypothetical protein
VARWLGQITGWLSRPVSEVKDFDEIVRRSLREEEAVVHWANSLRASSAGTVRPASASRIPSSMAARVSSSSSSRAGAAFSNSNSCALSVPL